MSTADAAGFGQADASPHPEGKSRKLGEIVADRIENSIMQMGWPIGRVIGSEAELLEQHQVSRAVLREAIRLLEAHGTATMRRGPGGGLVVTKPDARAVIRSAAVYLDSEAITPDKLSAARIAIELIAVQLAAEAIDEEGIKELRAVLEHEKTAIATGGRAGATRDVHSTLAKLSGNPAIQLFTETLAQLELDILRTSVASGDQITRFRQDFLEDHIAIVDAVIAGDAGIARYRMQQHLLRVGEDIHPHGSVRGKSHPA
ncbi:FadR/GntR family transcriptional regulator [Nocardia abscessus]|jgi:DNA-binding FadR family transcriptional regulator|uniref:FadR/GntR family transcriptional regulator n=1 Tax=Nocardia TaxID=1817 RepID=UPI0018948C3B|nr:FCD domain-containing protein [Nocardia abscessus]MBF6472583.1 FadR family transcriptional regulator [Nocardia abscessus]